jgi:hypothetical protein
LERARAVIPKQIIWAAGGAIVLAAASAWVYSVGGDHRENKLRREWDTERLALVTKGSAMLADEVAKGNRQAEEMNRRITDAQTQLEAADRAATTARDTGERLRVALATARTGARLCPPSTAPATPASSAAADATERVLADVQRRLDDAQNAVARHADASRIAGLACERSYDATLE